MPALVALLLEIAEAIPALRDLFLRLGDEIRRARLAATHDAIDAAVSAAQAAPWVCPAACPHRHGAAGGLRDAGPAGQALPPTP